MMEEAFPSCSTCGGPLPCGPCKKNAERPGTSRTDDRIEVVLPVGEDGADRVAGMLRERGYNPTDWQINSLTVNEWDSPTGAVLTQTKAHLSRVIPAEDTPWGRFVAAVTAVGATKREPVKRRKPKAGEPVVTVLMGDDQAPHVNWPLHEASLEALAEIRPDRFVYMGDGTDFDALSRYEVEHPEWASTVQEGLDSTHQVLAERMEAAGYPEGFYLSGNHEHRLQKFLLNKAKPLFGLRAADMPEDAASVLSIRFLLGLDSLGIGYATSPNGEYPHPTVEVAEGFYATHGWVARKGAGASALASVERLNASLAVGHTHRLAVGHLTRWTPQSPEVFTVVETGTMADLSGLGYSRNPDWQGGFAVVSSWPGGRYTVDLATWDRGSLYWRDRRW